MENIDLSGKNLASCETLLLKLKNPRTIKHLNLSCNNLKELPQNLSRFANLTSLNLLDNPIRRVC